MYGLALLYTVSFLEFNPKIIEAFINLIVLVYPRLPNIKFVVVKIGKEPVQMFDIVQLWV